MRYSRILGAPLLLIAGFGLGSATAPQIHALTFKNASLYEAMSKVHDNDGPDAVFKNEDHGGRSFDMPAGPRQQVVAALAKQYGRSAISLSHISVFTSPLPPADSARERLKALQAAIGTPDDLYNYYMGVCDVAHDLGQSLPPGQTPFSSLSPAQQQQALYLARAGQLQMPGMELKNLMERFNSAINPPPQ